MRSPPIFFFSSRRRHTRLTCDWSSDVCSSDLGTLIRLTLRALDSAAALLPRQAAGPEHLRTGRRGEEEARSEERRVGKECRSGGTPNGCKKKDRGLEVIEEVRAVVVADEVTLY